MYECPSAEELRGRGSALTLCGGLAALHAGQEDRGAGTCSRAVGARRLIVQCVGVRGRQSRQVQGGGAAAGFSSVNPM